MQDLHPSPRETIHEIADRFLSAPQDLSDLQAGDQVVILWEGSHDWYHPLLIYTWTISEACEDRLAFTMGAGPRFKRYFDRQGLYVGRSWDDGYRDSDFAERRLYRLSPEMDYLQLWRKLYLYVEHEMFFLALCSLDQLRRLHRALHRLDPRTFQSEARLMQAGEVTVPLTDYEIKGFDPFLQSVLAREQLFDLGHVRCGSTLLWAHYRGGGSWRLGRVPVTRTTRRFIWVGDPQEARKFDRAGGYCNQKRLGGFTLFMEQHDRLLLTVRETKQLLIRQQLLGDCALRRGTLIRTLPVEDLAPLYQVLKTFPHTASARQRDDTTEREIEQGLALLSLREKDSASLRK